MGLIERNTGLIEKVSATLQVRGSSSGSGEPG
eukprot:SAG31_NODE_29329_length_397_cov_0.553691_1_plen_31_part_10